MAPSGCMTWRPDVVREWRPGCICLRQQAGLCSAPCLQDDRLAKEAAVEVDLGK